MKTNKPKVYIHKKLGWVAEYDPAYDYGGGTDHEDIRPGYWIWESIEDFKAKKMATDVFEYIELIENSLDWELQPEKDWIDELKDDIMGLYKLHVKIPPHKGLIEEDYENMWKDIKFYIEKHMPKISKDEIENIGVTVYNGTSGMKHIEHIIELLKDKGMYKQN